MLWHKLFHQYCTCLQIFFCLSVSITTVAAGTVEQTRLLRQPALSANHIAFVYAGDIWLTARDGSNPQRLTSHPAVESLPKFSPDGKWIAFSANYGDNQDVYVISVTGGQPRRLTWHPGDDKVNGWTPDGENIVFTSRREMRIGRNNQIFHVNIKGGFPTKLMKAVAFEGAWSPDGKRFAYQVYMQRYYGKNAWRQYRGGASPPIWIIDPKTQQVEKIPHQLASDTHPVWLDNNVYFISDRNSGAANLYSYDTISKKLEQLTDETQWDARWLGAYGNTLIYEIAGGFKQFNIITRQIKEIKVSIKPDSQQLRPQWKDASATLQNIALSPTGKRALLTARGDVFTVPVKHGSVRNITKTSAVREQDALWSPSGKYIAYITDQGQQHRIKIVNQTGMGEAKIYDLGNAFYKLLAWGKNSKRIIYQDNHLNLFSLTLDDGHIKHIVTNPSKGNFEITLSPDGQWLVYTLENENYFSKLMLYHFKDDQHIPLTDAMSDANSPVFSRDGRFLFFAASTNAGTRQMGRLDMSTLEIPIRYGIYCFVLAKSNQSPLLLKTGDESDGETILDIESAKKDSVKNNGIDTEDIQQRIVALPITERYYDSLRVDYDGNLFYRERHLESLSKKSSKRNPKKIYHLHRFNFNNTKSSLIHKNISNYTISDDGKKILITMINKTLLTADIVEKNELDTESLSLKELKMLVDPRQEWQQIFNEAWRLEKEFFYDPNLHGLDWQEIYDRYHPLLKHVQTREDLNLLLIQMIAEMQVGHNRVSGGDEHTEKPVPVGLLGVDFRIEHGYYRIKKIYSGDTWNPFITGPLAAPGLGVVEGDYVLAIDGKVITETDNIFSFFENTVDKQVTLVVNHKAQLKNSRSIIVEPVSHDWQLRRWEWIEGNRRRVAEATDNKVGYVYLPNTTHEGYAAFNHMFFAQADKQAMIIDERRNKGGKVANYIIDVLSRRYLAGWKYRDGMDFHTPYTAVYGPKVMLINQDAGSGGDFLPYAFRRAGLGKLIGTRTWGGLIGFGRSPRLIDGGKLLVPSFRFYTPDGEWRVENEGVVPDIEVELEADDVNRGVDTQLERAIKVVMNELKTYQPVKPKKAPPTPMILGK